MKLIMPSQKLFDASYQTIHTLDRGGGYFERYATVASETDDSKQTMTSRAILERVSTSQLRASKPIVGHFVK